MKMRRQTFLNALSRRALGRFCITHERQQEGERHNTYLGTSQQVQSRRVVLYAIAVVLQAQQLSHILHRQGLALQQLAHEELEHL